MSRVRTVYMDLPCPIGGFVREKDGFYTIVLNQNLSRRQNEDTYRHEMAHIMNGDFDRSDVAEIENGMRGDGL